MFQRLVLSHVEIFIDEMPICFIELPRSIYWRVNMDDYRIWMPLDNVEPNKYLYHYTTYSTALRILYYHTLRLSSLSGTNDAFEQRPKLKCTTNDIEFRRLYLKAKKLFSRHQENIKLLCLSRDPDYNEVREQYSKMQRFLSHDQVLENVNGRGFALPRMWAQYAGNNTWVCLIFEKAGLEQVIGKNQIEVTHKPVTYIDYYIPLEITDSDKQIIKQILCDTDQATILSFIKKNSKFVDYHYFSKLKDWDSEHEYRYISFQTSKENESYIEISGIQNCLCGVVLGERINEVEKRTIQLLLAHQAKKIPLKQLLYCDLTTKIIPVSYDDL